MSLRGIFWESIAIEICWEPSLRNQENRKKGQRIMLCVLMAKIDIQLSEMGNMLIFRLQVPLTAGLIFAGLTAFSQDFSTVQPQASDALPRQHDTVEERFTHININPNVSPSNCAFATSRAEEFCPSVGEIQSYFVSNVATRGRLSRYQIIQMGNCVKVLSYAQPDHYGANPYICNAWELPAQVRLELVVLSATGDGG